MALDINSHYKLDELDGATVAIDETGTYNGIFVGNPSMEQPPIEIQGIGTSMLVHDDYIDIPDRDNIQGLSLNYKTYEYPDLNIKYLFHQRVDDVTRTLLSIQAFGTIYLYKNSIMAIQSNSPIIQNAYDGAIDYQIVIQYNPIDLKTYMWLNGVKQSMSYIGDVFTNSSIETRISAYESNNIIYSDVKFYKCLFNNRLTFLSYLLAFVR